MPKPVPPPPPQPSAEQTVAAVRLVFGLTVIAIALFLSWGSVYGNDYWPVDYGRENGTSWNIKKARTLDRDALRAHGGGKIAWLVGSSILRESFSQKRINATLEEAGSEWRVAKFGQTRGASGMSAGMLRHLPMRAGDRVIHGVAVENFRRGWVSFTEMPDWRLMLLLDSDEIWSIPDWTVSKKLEATVAVPADFYRYHDETMAGWIRWFHLPIRGIPRARKKSFHIGARQFTRLKGFGKVRELGMDSRYGIRMKDYDESETQFNMQGLQRMRDHCAAAGVDLTLIHIPQRKEYVETFIGPAVRRRWRRWMRQHDVQRFPQPEEDDYYDMKHPNYRGRAMLSDYMIDWLADPSTRPPTGWRKAYLEQRQTEERSETPGDGIESDSLPPLEAE
jgi:hypothetical protein